MCVFLILVAILFIAGPMALLMALGAVIVFYMLLAAVG